MNVVPPVPQPYAADAVNRSSKRRVRSEYLTERYRSERGKL
jgi:hypothetical protein